MVPIVTPCDRVQCFTRPNLVGALCDGGYRAIDVSNGFVAGRLARTDQRKVLKKKKKKKKLALTWGKLVQTVCMGWQL